jgi:hypothetical protein
VDWPFVIDLKNGALMAMTSKCPALPHGYEVSRGNQSFRTLGKGARADFSARGLFIKDRAESVAIMAKSPAVLFGE